MEWYPPGMADGQSDGENLRILYPVKFLRQYEDMVRTVKKIRFRSESMWLIQDDVMGERWNMRTVSHKDEMKA
jgi:hypothetical protein